LGIDTAKYQKIRAFTTREWSFGKLLPYINIILRKKKIILIIRVLIVLIRK